MSCPQFGYSNATSSQLLMSSQATAAAAGTPTASQLGSAASACCESGRPIITDPLTGQSVCSCQYDPQTQLLNYQRLASAGLPLYSAPYAEQGYIPLSAEQSAFYTPTTNGFDLKDNLGTWPYAASVYYPYDTTLAGYPFTNGYGVDLNGARRKSATRETTSTLKAWLNEHKKNPYPTKGEKIMLAIITKMTLTQVSTWFANARRRLKKENKMTWEPRNRVDDEDNTADNGDATDKESDKPGREGPDRDRDSPAGLLSRDVSSAALMSSSHGSLGLSGSVSSVVPRRSDPSSSDETCVRVGGGGLPGDESDDVDDDDDDDDRSISVSIGGSHDPLSSVSGGHKGPNDTLLLSDSMSSPSSVLSDPPSSIHSPLSASDSPHHHSNTTVVGPLGTELVGGPTVPHKPRIWSIVDTATSNNAAAPSSSSSQQQHLFSPHGASIVANGLGSSAGIQASPGVPSNGSATVAKVTPLARGLRLGDYAGPYAKSAAAWFNGSAYGGPGAAQALQADALLGSFSKPGLMAAHAAAAAAAHAAAASGTGGYALATALGATTTTTLSPSGARSCVQGLNGKGPLAPSPSTAGSVGPMGSSPLQRNNAAVGAAPRFHGAFTLNSKLDGPPMHQDQRQELQGPAS